MPISRTVVLKDVYDWLPVQSVLTDGQILSLAESVISNVGDDESNRPEIVCKTLRACAIANKSLSTQGNDIKREKSYQREIEYQDKDDTGAWDKYIENLSYLCPLLPGGGYTIQSPSSVGFYASVSEKIVVPDLSKVR